MDIILFVCFDIWLCGLVLICCLRLCGLYFGGCLCDYLVFGVGLVMLASVLCLLLLTWLLFGVYLVGLLVVWFG